MNIKCFVLGQLYENCYVINIGSSALIVDPGTESKEIEEYISSNNLNVLGILITHYHFDHIGGLEYYKNKYKVNVIDYMSDNDIVIRPFSFEIIKTYGHTLDSVTFYFKKESVMFTGDFLFKETIGNYEKSNEKYMIESLKKIKNYNSDILVYPGHEDNTTLGYEKKYNMYLSEL